jgi:alpha-1,3-mannosyltransferase
MDSKSFTEKRLIGPVEVAVARSAAATDAVLSAMRSRTPLLVAFCNAHTVNLARNDNQLRQSLMSALVLNDGVGLDLASRVLYGTAFPENLNGTDFCPSLLGASGGKARVFLLGGELGIAERASKEILRRYPDVKIAGTRHGFFDPASSEQILQDARSADANILLVGMGQPKQEIWAARHYSQFAGPVVCVGALLDFLAGRFPRAPKLVRQLRLEWAFRLVKEPIRLARRYLIGNLTFIFYVLADKIGSVLKRH